MFCFLSHLIEDCYFDNIEMFFFVVGHTHNILDQWFGVLARAIRSANFIGSVFALHAIYKIAHDIKVEHLRPREVHQLRLYHDWRKFYTPVRNDEIHHFNIPLRWKLTRDELLGVAIARYMVVSPTSGLTHLETWQPVPSQMTSIECNGSVGLSLFMTYNGPENLFNSIGINTTKHATSIDLLTAVATKDSTGSSVSNAADVLPIIRRIEARAIGETEVRFEQEAETGASIEKVALPKEYLHAIDRELTQSNSSKGGRIVWLRRSKIADDPNYLYRRPDILPNPVLWRSIIATDGTKRKLAQADALAAGLPPPKFKSDPEVALAESRLMTFQKAASEMAVTANLVLKLVPSQIDVTSDTTNIKKATSGFRKPVLTQMEFDWYESIKTPNHILQQQQSLVNAESTKPWELLSIPLETPEQRRWREALLAERAVITARTEAALRKLVHRIGEGEYDPHLQVVAMDGFKAAETQDIDKMKKPQLLSLAKGRITNYSKLKVEALRAAIKAYLTANPGVLQLVGDEEESNAAAVPITITARPSTNNDAIATDSDAENDDDIEPTVEASTTGPAETEATECPVMECKDAAIVWCEKCSLSFCSYLHSAHTSHASQTKKPGVISNYVWGHEIGSVDEVVADQENDLSTTSRKRNLESDGSTDPVDKLRPQPSQTRQHANLGSLRPEGDNADKRAQLEKEKVQTAVNFIKSLQTNKTLGYDILYQKFNYQNYYDAHILCLIADAMYVDVSEISTKRRFSQKELLNCLISKLI